MGRKRFTDADKWEDGWFGEQTSAVKLFWIYLCDRCDHSGVWEISWRLVRFHIGEVDQAAIEKALSGRVVPIKDGRAWFIPGFIKFQYANTLRSSVRPQLAVINLMYGHGVDPEAHGIQVIEDGRPIHRNAISENTRAKVLTKCGNKCTYCGVSGDVAELTMDHIIPISKGGSGKESNLTAACRSCNSSKSNSMERVSELHPSSCQTAKDKDRDTDKDKDSSSSAEDLFNPKAMAQAKAIMAADLTPKPPLPQVRSFTDFRAMHGRCFVGRDERPDWEALFKVYEWDAMHEMHEALTDDRIYLNVAIQWLSKNYRITG